MKNSNDNKNIEENIATETTFKPKKSLGQNFLTSDIVPNWMCDSASLKKGEVVLEIGAGTGKLTKTLLDRGALVLAIETDQRAIKTLEETFAKEINTKQLTIYNQDVRNLNLSSLNLTNHEFKVVANIPYYLSGFLFRVLLSGEIQPQTLTFLIQKELAERIARDKKSSILSLSVKAFGFPEYQKTVSKGHFFPKPKIDSAIITISNINQDNFLELSQDFFFSIIHLGLGKKRKQLLGNLSYSFKRQQLEKIFLKLNLSPTIRGEDLTIETWLLLAKELQNLSTS